ncbi:PROBABLE OXIDOREDUCTASE PROTEIN(EC:1.-) [hydrothermal vent metagenome]|uniref:PROBABLE OXIDOREDUCTASE PROTEIN( EC:1.- ) n=1 Tax=hydrothermal vent metagenome TaxID=652676 RepID=A0A3B0ZR98_9ZZZZ
MTQDKKTVLVTGGTRGIGKALVDSYVRSDWHVIATGRSEETIITAQKTYPSVQWIACNMAIPSERSRFSKQLEDTPLDLIIHNAGIQQARNYFKPMEESYSVTNETEINFLAPVELTRSLMDNIKKTAGHLVYITSGLAIAPKQSSPIYCANKAGLRTFVKSLRQQSIMYDSGVLVTEVIMALVDTDMTRGRGKGKILPTEAARQITKGIEKRCKEIHIGKVKGLMLLRKLMPNLAEQMLIKL